jgi:hypothetical protein
VQRIDSPYGTIFWADNLWDKTRGVIGREDLLQEGPLYIPSCNWIHTFFLRSSIQVVFISQEFEILRQIPEVRVNSFSPFMFDANGTIEMLPSYPLDRLRALLYYLPTS